ncbi:MAG: hypothetical protein WAQ53_15635 [Thiofilum sp.]|uniref:hypothetical protein n=1 Tax=Thiofilum sp. TaxID=2212733 RepID=UPI0025EA256D|nr:hypothetical protein [Thiofilum sp.]MBK8452168.1 hypothetical protein [Thiofilum sp.]
MACSSIVWAGSLTGTWSGTVSNGRETERVVLRFSSNDNFINNYGELTHVGQVQRSAPPGGGVITNKVLLLNKSRNGLQVVQEVSFEKTSNGYLHQDYARVGHDIKLTPQGLQVQISARNSSYTSDVGSAAGGGNGMVVATGVLRKSR